MMHYFSWISWYKLTHKFKCHLNTMINYKIHTFTYPFTHTGIPFRKTTKFCMHTKGKCNLHKKFKKMFDNQQIQWKYT